MKQLTGLRIDHSGDCLGGAAVMALGRWDFRSSGRGFDHWPARNQSTSVNSAFHPSGIDQGWNCRGRLGGLNPLPSLCLQTLIFE